MPDSPGRELQVDVTCACDARSICQRCFEVVLIRTAIRFSSTAAALPSHASSMHHDTPSEEVAVLAHAYGTGRTCLYRSAVDARLAGRLHARAQGSGCGED